MGRLSGDNQNNLDLHNAGFDRWERLTSFQKEQEINFGGINDCFTFIRLVS